MSWTTQPRTLAELEGALDKAGLSMCIHHGAGPERYVIHLYAPDDPLCFVVGEGDSLAIAVADALTIWSRDAMESHPPKSADDPKPEEPN